jgi:hypothetical protein
MRGMSYGKVTGLTAVVAAAVSTTVQAEGGAVSLDVPDALAVVALFGWKRVSIASIELEVNGPYSRWYGAEGRR